MIGCVIRTPTHFSAAEIGNVVKVDPRETNHDLTRVFGTPYEAGEVTIIPVARISRAGDGIQALGVYAVRGSEVAWHPAVNGNRIALIGVLTGFVAALLGTVAVIRRPPWPDLRREIR